MEQTATQLQMTRFRIPAAFGIRSGKGKKKGKGNKKGEEERPGMVTVGYIKKKYIEGKNNDKRENKDDVQSA